MITQFHVENFKALKDVTLDLTPIHVLIGPNDSGKTSILQAMAALSRTAEQTVDKLLIGRWNNNPILWNAKRQGQLIFEYKISEGTHGAIYSIDIEVSNYTTMSYVSEQIFNSSRVIQYENIPTNITEVNSNGRNPNTQYPVQFVFRNIRGFGYYRWDAQLMCLPVAIDKNRYFQLDSNGFGLAQLLDNLLGTNRKNFEELEQRYKSYFQDVETIQLLPEDAFRSDANFRDFTPRLSPADGKGIWFKLKGVQESISASQVSEGMIIVLAYLAILHSPNPPRLILIEEPENGIHPQRLREILKILRELVSEQRHTQVIMTTHSPDVVAEFSPEEVTLCSKNQEGAVITRRLSEIPDVKKYGDFFTLGEIWMMKGDDNLIKNREEIVPGVAT